MGNSGPPRAGAIRWAKTLAESETPVFLLDAQRHLIVFNQGCARWTGWSAEELLGRTCDYVTEADPQSQDAILAVFAPPAEVWQGQPAEVPAFLPSRNAAPQAVRIRFQPLLDAAQRVIQVLGILLPVTAPLSSVTATPAQTLHAELAALRQSIRNRYGEETVIARSSPMRRVMSQLVTARQSACSVLYQGERGAGREFLARVLHTGGPLAKRAFVPVDCQRTDSFELKRILRHLKEDSPGNDALRIGTLFLAEVTSAPRDVQERLSEWLDEGASADSPRVMAATSQPLDLLAERDLFHRELYFQLTSLVIAVPPLRQRGDDLMPLAQFFLEDCNRHAVQQLTGFSPEAMETLRRYAWPGNVAELRAVVNSAAASSAGPLITPENFPPSFRAGQDAQRLGPPPEARLPPLETLLEQVEREQIQAALAVCRQNLSKAASLLGMSRPKLYRRMQALGLTPDNP